MRGVLFGTLLIWVVTAAGVAIFSGQILNTLHISVPALVVTVLLGLVTMWKPIFYGVLLSLVAVGIAIFYGRRRSKAAIAKRREATAARSGGR